MREMKQFRYYTKDAWDVNAIRRHIPCVAADSSQRTV